MRDTTDYFDSHFKVEWSLGAGEFSDALAARFLVDNQLYAVKRTKVPYLGMRDRERKLEEVEIMWRIGDHPHCIRLEDAWEQNGSLYMQMDMCPGGSLKEYIDAYGERGPLEEKYIWRFFSDLAKVRWTLVLVIGNVY
jgi:serine/threonine protein kinase